MSRRGNKNNQITEKDLQEIEEFVYSKNVEEEKFLQTMSINVKCK